MSHTMIIIIFEAYVTIIMHMHQLETLYQDYGAKGKIESVKFNKSAFNHTQ